MSVQAMPLCDPIDDVWAQLTQTKGSFTPSIDIVQVSPQGSTVIIECNGLIASSPNLTLTSTEVSFNYFLLFSDDGDPTNWEAAIMLSLHSASEHEAYWIVASQMADPVDFWQIDPGCSGWWGRCNGWSMGIEGNHYMIYENQVIFYFLEFAGILSAEILCVTMAVVGAEVYYDWAPNFYESTRHFKVSIPKGATTTTLPPLPITTRLITETPTSTTPVSSETTTPPSDSVITTSEELITSLTETEPTPSAEQKTTSSESTTPSETPGFGTLSVLMALPILVWIRRRVR